MGDEKSGSKFDAFTLVARCYGISANRQSPFCLRHRLRMQKTDPSPTVFFSLDRAHKNSTETFPDNKTLKSDKSGNLSCHWHQDFGKDICNFSCSFRSERFEPPTASHRERHTLFPSLCIVIHRYGRSRGIAESSRISRLVGLGNHVHSGFKPKLG